MPLARLCCDTLIVFPCRRRRPRALSHSLPLPTTRYIFSGSAATFLRHYPIFLPPSFNRPVRERYDASLSGASLSFYSIPLVRLNNGSSANTFPSTVIANRSASPSGFINLRDCQYLFITSRQLWTIFRKFSNNKPNWPFYYFLFFTFRKICRLFYRFYTSVYVQDNGQYNRLCYNLLLWSILKYTNVFV